MAALWISPPADFTSAVSLASSESGIEMRTVPLNCHLLSSKSTPVVTARSALIRMSPCVIVTAPYSTTPFWLSKFSELALSWIGSCSRSCAPAPAAASASSRAASLRSGLEVAIDVRFQLHGSGLEVGLHAERAHPVRAEGELDRRLSRRGLADGVERKPPRVQFGGAGLRPRLPREVHVALELDRAPARRDAGLVRRQVPELPGGRVVVDCH